MIVSHLIKLSKNSQLISRIVYPSSNPQLSPDRQSKPLTWQPLSTLLLLLAAQNVQQSFAKLLERDPLLFLLLLLIFTILAQQASHQQVATLLQLQRVAQLDQRFPVQPAARIDVVRLEHLEQSLLVRIRREGHRLFFSLY